MVMLTLLACVHANDTALDVLRAPPEGSMTAGSFAGRVPCGDAPSACQRIKVALSLHRDAVSGQPTTYLLEWIHVGVDDVRHTAAGTWSESRGLEWDSDARVWQLEDGGEHHFNAYLVIQERVLVFLDPDGDAMVGDEGYAYALSASDL